MANLKSTFGIRTTVNDKKYEVTVWEFASFYRFAVWNNEVEGIWAGPIVHNANVTKKTAGNWFTLERYINNYIMEHTL